MNKADNTRPQVKILLVDDNPGEAELTRIAFKSSRVVASIETVEDGEEALDFLYKRNDFAEAATPDIVLLDLNMPKMDGKEVLADVKSSNELRNIPVMVFTTSRSQNDIDDSYRLHANSYIVKPSSLANYSDVVSAVERFWFSVASLPKN